MILETIAFLTKQNLTDLPFISLTQNFLLYHLITTRHCTFHHIVSIVRYQTLVAHHCRLSLPSQLLDIYLHQTAIFKSRQFQKVTVWKCCFRMVFSQEYTIFRKKGVLKNFAIFTRKHLCWSLFGVLGVNLINKRLQHRYFPVNITKLFMTPFLINIWEKQLF